MTEIIKEFGDLLKLIPETAIWIVAGLLLYKVVIVGSVFGVARLLIIKFHDWGVRPKTVKHTLSLQTVERDLITCDQTPREFFNFIRSLKGLHPSTRNLYSTTTPRSHERHGAGHIHSCDLRWALEAIEMRKQSELQEKQ